MVVSTPGLRQLPDVVGFQLGLVLPLLRKPLLDCMLHVCCMRTVLPPKLPLKQVFVSRPPTRPLVGLSGLEHNGHF